MKAIIQERYGSVDVLTLRDIEEPRVGDDDVLVRVRAASVHPDVWHVMKGRPYALRLMGAGLLRPANRVPGTDVAGDVVAVGKHVTRFLPGTAVFGESIRSHQWTHGGAYAEYVAVPQDNLVAKPEHASYAQAAAVPTAGYIALFNLRDEGQVRPGHRVLINGAGGGVGTLAVQLAKAFGAEVTGVDCASKLELIRSLGADRVIDYQAVDFTRGTERYDLIFDVPGNHTFWACRRALTPNGRYVLIGHEHFRESGRVLGQLPRFLGLALLAPFVRGLPKLGSSMPSKQASMAVLGELLAAGKLTPVIDRTFSLSEVPAALRYLQEGRALGRIVITI